MSKTTPARCGLSESFAQIYCLLIIFLALSFPGADTTNVTLADAWLLLSDTLRDFMYSTGFDNGLKALGYTSDDISVLQGNFASTSRDRTCSSREPWGGRTGKIIRGINGCVLTNRNRLILVKLKCAVKLVHGDMHRRESNNLYS